MKNKEKKIINYYKTKNDNKLISKIYHQIYGIIPATFLLGLLLGHILDDFLKKINKIIIIDGLIMLSILLLMNYRSSYYLLKEIKKRLLKNGD